MASKCHLVNAGKSIIDYARKRSQEELEKLKGNKTMDEKEFNELRKKISKALDDIANGKKPNVISLSEVKDRKDKTLRDRIIDAICKSAEKLGW